MVSAVWCHLTSLKRLQVSFVFFLSLSMTPKLIQVSLISGEAVTGENYGKFCSCVTSFSSRCRRSRMQQNARNMSIRK